MKIQSDSLCVFVEFSYFILGLIEDIMSFDKVKYKRVLCRFCGRSMIMRSWKDEEDWYTTEHICKPSDILLK